MAVDLEQLAKNAVENKDVQVVLVLTESIKQVLRFSVKTLVALGFWTLSFYVLASQFKGPTWYGIITWLGLSLLGFVATSTI